MCTHIFVSFPFSLTLSFTYMRAQPKWQPFLPGSFEQIPHSLECKPMIPFFLKFFNSMGFKTGET